MYLLAKFQLHILITYGVTALQSSNNRTIDLYSEYRGNKLQAHTKMVVTYKPIEAVFAIVLTINKGMDYWVSFSFTHPSSLHLKAKFMKKNRSRTIVSTWRKQAPITYESLDLLQRNKDFQTPLSRWKRWCPGFCYYALLSLRKKRSNNLRNIFNNTQICTQCSQCFILQI